MVAGGWFVAVVALRRGWPFRKVIPLVTLVVAAYVVVLFRLLGLSWGVTLAATVIGAVYTSLLMILRTRFGAPIRDGGRQDPSKRDNTVQGRRG
jgi:hypothetical protein